MGEVIAVFAIFALLVMFRVPVAAGLGLAALVGMFLSGLDPVNSVTQLYRGLDVFVILAVPFFLTVGFLANSSSIGDRLLQFSAAIIGRVRGSLGHLNVLVSMLFAGLSGSATADAAGEGSVTIPLMIKRGYSPEYSAAITAISSVIGSIIPPSLIMIIYGAFAGVSVGALFAAGIVPGVLVGLGYMVVNYFHARKHDIDYGLHALDDVSGMHYGRHPTSAGGSTDDVAAVKAAIQEPPAPEGQPPFWKITLRAVPPLMVPVILLGGITFGVFTPTEAGAVALVYVLVLVLVLYREMKVGQVVTIFRQAVSFYSLPLLAAATATVFGFVVTVMNAPDLVDDFISGLDLPSWGFLLVVMASFFLIGTFLDAFPAIVIFTPIFLPVAETLDVHPIRLGIVICMMLSLGLTTPPYGLCLLIAAKIAKCSVAGTARALVPFWLVTIGVVLLVVIWPDALLAIPRALYPQLFP